MTGVSFEEYYQHAACALVTTDDRDTILTVNETFLEWTGYPRAEVVGRPFHDLLSTGSQIFYETRSQAVLRMDGEMREIALELTRSDGSPLPILTNAHRAIDEASGEKFTRIAFFDYTERQEYERDLLLSRRRAELSEERVRTLQRASSAFLSADSEGSVGEALAEIAREAFSAADAAVVLYGEDGSLRVAAGEHRLQLLAQLQALSKDTTVRGSEVVTVPNLRVAREISPPAAELLRSARTEAFSAVPLAGSSGALGALALFYGRAREFDASAIELHEALAQQASLALDRLRLQTELVQRALHDQLTGLANRNLLSERLSHTLAHAERTGRAMALVFLDLDGFKAINDELGHRVGDQVLQTMADRVNSVVREADIVGRFGGDEFLIICEDADEHDARLVAQRVVSTVAEPLLEIDGGRNLTTSIGIAVFNPGERASPTNDELVRAADSAMYESKYAGPGRITVVTL